MKRLLLGAALLLPLAAQAQAQGLPISGLPSATAANLTDLIPCVQLGSPNVTRKCTGAQLTALGAGTYLPLAGGTLTGPFVLSASGLSVTGVNAISVTWPTNVAATGGQVTNATVQGFADDSSTNSNAGWWGVLGRANFDGTTNQARPFIGVQGQGVLGSNASLGGPASTPQIWGLIGDAIDFTKAKSSQTNALTGAEIDVETNNVDDANVRQAITVNLVDHATEYGGTGIPPRFLSALHIVTTEASGPDRIGIKFPIQVNANFDVAALDLRGASPMDGKSGSNPAVASPGTAGTTVPVTDVFPFTNDKLGLDLDNGSNGHASATVYINGTPYTQTAYSITGNGPAGTITVTSAVGADGTTGNSLIANSHTVWLGSFGDIAFDYAGTNGIPNVRIYGDNKSLNVIGGLKLQRISFTSLPTCNAGAAGTMYGVFNVVNPGYNVTLASAGGAEVVGYCNGTNWVAH